jgi:hypothetical protein
LRNIQELLGHESSKTTEFYTHIAKKSWEKEKKVRWMIWKYERHAYFCSSKNPAMNNLTRRTNFRRSLPALVVLWQAAFFFGGMGWCVAKKMNIEH